MRSVGYTLLYLLDHDILGRARTFIESLPPMMMDRAINWAYLHKTQDSFAIEKEAPTESKARRFIQLLRQAHERLPLTEDYLVNLQNATLSNPLDLAAAFRHEQNHLANGGFRLYRRDCAASTCDAAYGDGGTSYRWAG